VQTPLTADAITNATGVRVSLPSLQFSVLKPRSSKQFIRGAGHGGARHQQPVNLAGQNGHLRSSRDGVIRQAKLSELSRTLLPPVSNGNSFRHVPVKESQIEGRFANSDGRQASVDTQNRPLMDT
jgi:hypothetical protein